MEKNVIFINKTLNRGEVKQYFDTEQSAINHIKKLGKEGYFTPEYYPVETPVTRSGGIMFGENNKQFLYTDSDGELYVNICTGKNYSYLFVWVPCKREDLRNGDTAYRRDIVPEVCPFDDSDQICCIGGDEYWFESNPRIVKNKLKYSSWYKLTPKSELGIE